jgi:glycogen operon protein
VEGTTDDAAILGLRERQFRNLIATLLLSQGMPMICGGDEIGRTQRGNNNAYAQDNDISWFDWNLTDSKRALFEFTRELIELRKTHPNLHRRKFFQDRRIDPDAAGRAMSHGSAPAVQWLRPDGREMKQDEWLAGWIRCVGLVLNGETVDDVNAVGEPIIDDTFLFLFNPHHQPVRFMLPRPRRGVAWDLCFDTSRSKAKTTRARRLYPLTERSLAVFRTPKGAAPVLAGLRI